ncbi:MAG: ATP-binding protein [bacterium]
MWGEVDPRCQMWLEALTASTVALESCPFEAQELAKALKPLAENSKGSAALMLMRFLQDKAAYLEVVARYPEEDLLVSGSPWPQEMVDVSHLPAYWLENLKAGRPVLEKNPQTPVLGQWQNLLIFPLCLEKELSALLCLGNYQEAREGLVFEGLKTASGIFTLWLGWLNEKRRLEDFIQFMPNPTFVMHRRGHITAWNRATEEMTGWEASRVLNKGDYEHAIPYYGIRRPILCNLILEPDPYWESTYPEFHRVGNDLYTLSFCPALPEGGAYLTTKTSKVFDVTGRLWGSIHTVRDVTRERQIERSLHRSESMYRAITDFAGIGMMLLQRDRVTYCNEQMSNFLGSAQGFSSLEELLGRVHQEQREAIKLAMERLLEGKQDSFRLEIKLQREGQTRHCQCFAQVVEYEEQPTVCFIMEDVTEQKELAHKARLNELRMYHEDRLTALGVMAAGIAHELNQPLNTIRVITDGLLFGRDQGWSLEQEELYENLEMVSRQVVRMSEVIRNIRDFAREDRFQTEDEVNPNQAVQGVFSMIGRQLEAHGIKVQKLLDSSLPTVRGRLSRLEQVVMNMIVNARQALDDCGKEDKELRVQTFSSNGCICIQVADNATGVDPGIMSKIFDPFFTTKEVGKGTGLGLTISQSIVAEMGGTMEVFNNEQGGATFVVKLPLKGERC